LESPLSNGVTSSLLLNLTAEKSSVYENGHRLLLLGFVSLITTVSQFVTLITTLQQNWTKNEFFEKKRIFHVFLSKNKQRSCWQFCRTDQTLSKSKGSWETNCDLTQKKFRNKDIDRHLKKSDLNYNTQLFFDLNNNTSLRKQNKYSTYNLCCYQPLNLISFS